MTHYKGWKTLKFNTIQFESTDTQNKKQTYEIARKPTKAVLSKQQLSTCVLAVVGIDLKSLWFPTKNIENGGECCFNRILLLSLPLETCSLLSLSNTLVQARFFQLCFKLKSFNSDVSVSFRSIQHFVGDSVRGNFAGVPKSLEKLESESNKSKHLVIFFFGVLETKGSNK